jgi:NADPH-dependent 2,4-dienoyl-CoA reductase/sulfur reductase-like enzyme/rhodanese-related sulfurtransferase
MSKKYIIVGGVTGGASTATRIRRLDEKAEITIYEKNGYVSFSNCCLPYYLGGLIGNKPEDLILLTPDNFKHQYNINVQVNSLVTEIDPKEKIITVKNVQTGEIKKDSYDDLILSPGADPVRPKSIEGIDASNVFTVRNVDDVRAIHDYLEKQDINDVAVIGGGFIGLEVTENLVQTGKHVSLIEAADHVLATVDDEFAQIVQKELYDHGVNVILRDGLAEIKKDKIILGSGREIKAKAVIVAIGVKPDTALARKAGCKLGVTGSIQVNQGFETSVPHIYAVGDAIELTNAITRKITRLALAFPAQMEARKVADHLYKRQITRPGVIGSQAIHIFDINVSSTGLTEAACRKEGIDCRVATVIPKDKVGLMPGAKPLYLKLVFDYPSGEILGAQALGYHDVDKQIDIIATAIQFHAHVQDLEDLQLAYSPWFSTAKNAVNMVGLVATNILNNEYKQVEISKVRELVEKGATIIDARERNEFEEGHIKGAINIPLSEFREKLDQIPKDKPVYVHCLSGQRSYNMVRALGNLGFTNIYNISGSYLELCEYEYFRDQTTDRKPIVTKYRFDLL